MKKKNFIKKIKEKISKFFEEEEHENEEEEINLKTLIIIFLIVFVIIISIYLYTNKGFGFIKSELNERGDMKQNDNREIIQFEDYFMEREGLENSDFSKGTNHWSTSKRNKFYDGSISNITLNKKDYHSLPQSLQITCLESSCRTYYNTKSNSTIIDSPYKFNSGIWMGIKPKTKLKISYWYKGDKHHISFSTLDKYGNFDNLEDITSKHSEKWIKKDVVISIPENVRAFGISMFIGKKGYLLLDDVQLEKIE